MYNNAIYPSHLNELPIEPYWVIYLSDSYMSPGYDPGDSAYSTPYVNFRVYLTELDWQNEIKDLILKGKEFRAAKVNPVSVNFDLKLKY